MHDLYTPMQYNESPHTTNHSTHTTQYNACTARLARTNADLCLMIVPALHPLQHYEYHRTYRILASRAETDFTLEE